LQCSNDAFIFVWNQRGEQLATSVMDFPSARLVIRPTQTSK
jgi:hypothetical protein